MLCCSGCMTGSGSVSMGSTSEVGLVGYREVGHWQGAQRRRCALFRQGGCECAVACDLCSPPPQPSCRPAGYRTGSPHISSDISSC